MEEALRIPRSIDEQNRRIRETVRRERGRLLNFIRRRVADAGEAEDILQDVFSELVVAYRLMHPIGQVAAWLYRVARNRAIDSYRKKRPKPLVDVPVRVNDEESAFALEDLLPSPEAGPEAAFARSVLMEEIDAAIQELPGEQREVFVAHEIDGRSFKELAEETGVSVNTLLSRKRYAVLHLRRRLRAIYSEFMNQ